LLRAIGDHARAAAVLGRAPAEVATPPRPPPPSGASLAGSVPSIAPPSSGIASAAYQARTAGRPREAAELFVRANLPYEAGVCFFEAGDLDASLAQLVTLPPTHPRYRHACVRVVHIVARTGALAFETDNFVAAFARTEPTTPNEVIALHALGALYQSHGFDDEAREAFERVLRHSPGHEDAARRLAALVPRAAEGDYAAIAKQDLSFWAPARRASPDPDTDVVQRAPADASISIEVGSLTADVEAIPLGPGAMVAGRYAIEREVGRGGMGVVYAARDVDLGEHVALKAFSVRADDPGLVARFKQELTLSRQLSHENVIRLYDMGVHAGSRFITMELLEGDTLKSKIDGLPLASAYRYLAQISSGLAAIHARGVVHRDVKPANVFVTTDDVVKIMDFGLAKKQDAPEGITVSGFMAGTPGYMPPEQITSFGSVTAAADVYALGVLAYEITTGVRPFRHKDPSQIYRMQFTSEPTPLHQVNPQLPETLGRLVSRMLDRDPLRRPATSEVLAVIEALRG
jgi:serine/threonine-protein kinase